jgi:fatty acid desaturase
MDPSNYADIGLVFFLFGIFCAQWAQNTQRSALLWFFLGWFLAPFTGLVLLYKNGQDQARARNQGS